MRVVHLTPHYWPTLGGCEIHCQKVSEALAARGHEVHVVSSEAHWPLPLRRDDERLIGRRREHHGGVDIQRLRVLAGLERLLPHLYRLPIPLRANLRRILRRRAVRHFAERAREAVAALEPDVVVAFSWTNPISPALRAVEGGCPWPLVALPLRHVDDPNAALDRIGAEVRGADFVITNTTFEAEGYVTGFGVDPDRVSVAGVGRDLPAEAGPYPREPRVLYLGRLTLVKGVGRLVDAMQQVWAERPDARLVLAGARRVGTEDVDALIGALPESVRARIDSLEDLDEEAKADQLSRATCLVLPSTLESFGMVLTEAWSHGTPVVTYDLPVFRCTVTHAADGLLVPPDDDRALAGAIGSLLADPDLAERLGRAGRRRAEAWPGWDEIAARHEAIYARAIDESLSGAGTRPRA